MPETCVTPACCCRTHKGQLDRAALLRRTLHRLDPLLLLLLLLLLLRPACAFRKANQET
jgi:hypothetical protein